MILKSFEYIIQSELTKIAYPIVANGLKSSRDGAAIGLALGVIGSLAYLYNNSNNASAIASSNRKVILVGLSKYLLCGALTGAMWGAGRALSAT